MNKSKMLKKNNKRFGTHEPLYNTTPTLNFVKPQILLVLN